MTYRLHTAFVILMLAHALAACEGHRSTPIGPTVPQPAPQTAVVQVSGHVYDTAFRALSDVKIEVLDGPSAGMTTTSSLGSFNLSGAFDVDNKFKATGAGYVSSTRSVSSVSNRRGTLDFLLEALVPPANIAGDHTLTFNVDAACGFPDDLQSRTYEVTVQPASATWQPPGTLFRADIKAPALIDGYNAFSIGVAGDYLGFSFHPEADWALLEPIDERRYFAVNGEAGALMGSTISTRFSGELAYCELSSGPGPFSACVNGRTLRICSSNNNRLVWTRR